MKQYLSLFIAAILVLSIVDGITSAFREVGRSTTKQPHNRYYLDIYQNYAVLRDPEEAKLSDTLQWNQVGKLDSIIIANNQ